MVNLHNVITVVVSTACFLLTRDSHGYLKVTAIFDYLYNNKDTGYENILHNNGPTFSVSPEITFAGSLVLVK